MAELNTPSRKRWEAIQARDNANQHNGDTYNVTNNYGRTKRNPAEREENDDGAWRKALLGWLVFTDIHDRREQVREAHQDTFRWIFEDGHETGFAKWLRTGNGIYWIKGKPASGKSTLMKFITDDTRLRDLSKDWAGSAPLVIGSFWFWAAGTTLQRSLLGLYRTLLYQILKAEDSLCRIAFPEWQPRFSDQDPTMQMLTIAMKQLLASASVKSNFLFVIDGLDEFDRDNIGKAQLADLMWDMTRSSKVKLLLSSRPETPFEISFRRCPALRLEDLTKADIVRFVESRLWSNPSVRVLSAVERAGIEDIAQFIVKNAKGVFLWVALVLDIALDGINSHEDSLVIRDRVMLLPPELDSLFAHILTKRIPQHCRSEVSRGLLASLELRSRNSEGYIWISIIAMAEQAHNYEQACYLAACDWERVQADMAAFQNRLKSRYQGLLEAAASPVLYSVTFMHRSLVDFLNRGEKAHTLLMVQAGSEFELYTAMMAGICCTFTYNYFSASCLLRGSLLSDSSGTILDFFKFNVLAEEATGRHRTDLIAILDQQVTADRERGAVPKVGHWSNGLCFENLRPASDLVAFVIYQGGVLHFQEVVRRNTKLSVKTLASLLQFAAPPWPSVLDGRVFQDFHPNTKAVAFLLELGADSTCIIRGRSFWTCTLDRLVNCLQGGSLAGIEESLHVAVLLAELTRGQHMDDTETTSYYQASAVRILRKQVLEGPLSLYDSEQARSCKGLANKALQYLEKTSHDADGPVEVSGRIPAETARSEPKLSRLKFLRGLTVKRLLPSRHRNTPDREQ